MLAIHTVLHPRHKLEFLCIAGWLPTWIETARELVTERYKAVSNYNI
jgi:hypothetical protein